MLDNGRPAAPPETPPADPADRALSERVSQLRLAPAVVSHGGGGNWKSIVLWSVLSGCVMVVVTAAAMDILLGKPAPGKAADAAVSSQTDASGNPTGTATAATAESGNIAHQSKGYIIPARQIRITPKVSGMLLTLNVQEGLRVNKGEVLAVIEDIEYRADLNRAKAAVALAEQALLELENGSRPEEIQQAEADLAESDAQLTQLEAEWKRNTGLAKKNVLSQEEYEKTYSRYLAMQKRAARLQFALTLMRTGPRVERIEMARAELGRAKADETKAQWRLDNCTISAPISGTILTKNAEEGNIVNPIAFSGSFSICDMADLSDLEADLAIEERSVSKIFKGQKCKIGTEAFPDRSYDGYVSRLMPIADRAKASISVRVKISVPAEEEGVYLKPEMGVLVTFLNDKKPAARTEPRTLTPEPSP